MGNARCKGGGQKWGKSRLSPSRQGGAENPNKGKTKRQRTAKRAKERWHTKSKKRRFEPRKGNKWVFP